MPRGDPSASPDGRSPGSCSTRLCACLVPCGSRSLLSIRMAFLSWMIDLDVSHKRPDLIPRKKKGKKGNPVNGRTVASGMKKIPNTNRQAFKTYAVSDTYSFVHAARASNRTSRSACTMGEPLYALLWSCEYMATTSCRICSLESYKYKSPASRYKNTITVKSVLPFR